MIYSTMMNHRWHLNFINPVSVREVALDMLTLLAVHEYNWPMFPELLILLISSFILGLILSGKPLRSLLTALFSLYSSFFCLGFSWFAVNPKHPSFSHFSSPLPDHVTYSIFYILFFSRRLSLSTIFLLTPMWLIVGIRTQNLPASEI